MKASELREILKKVPDDTELHFALQTKVPKEQLEKMLYPYPYNFKKLTFGGYDYGHSERELNLFVEEAQDA